VSWVPSFVNKSFAQVAEEYGNFQKDRAAAGDITRRRWKIVESHTRLHLIPYIGNMQVTAIGNRGRTMTPAGTPPEGAAMCSEYRVTYLSGSTMRGDFVPAAPPLRAPASAKLRRGLAGVGFADGGGHSRGSLDSRFRLRRALTSFAAVADPP
jgi:hypothetical protein